MITKNTMVNIFYIYAHYKKSDGTLFYIGKGKKYRAWDKVNRNKHWKNIVKKHDYTVKLLYENLEESEAYKKEVELIAELKPSANYSKGGKGGGIATYGFMGKKHSKESIQKISLAHKGKHKDLPALGRKSALEKTSHPILDNTTGITYSSLRKTSISLHLHRSTILENIGIRFFYVKDDNYISPLKGTKLAKEHKEKISESLKGMFAGDKNVNFGKPMPKETRTKISKNSCKNKKVVDISTGKIFTNIREAAEAFQINRNTLKQYLVGRRTNKTTLKYL